MRSGHATRAGADAEKASQYRIVSTDPLAHACAVLPARKKQTRSRARARSTEKFVNRGPSGGVWTDADEPARSLILMLYIYCMQLQDEDALRRTVGANQ